MQRIQIKLLGCVVLAGISISWCCSAASSDLPSADEVIKKVVSRAKWTEQHDFEKQYAFVKATQSDHLDDDGRVVRRSEKAVQVVPAADGRSRVKIDVGSKRLTDQEVELLAATQVHRSRSSSSSSKNSQRMRIELTEDMIERFDFTVQRREPIGRRSAFVVQFVPKPGGLPVRKLQDHFVNRAAGTVWIDEQDYEVVKAEIRLSEPVAITGGILGAVEGFRYFMERTRVDDGVWLLKQTDLFIRGRKFLTPIHTRKLERWSDFKKVSAG